MRGYAAIRRRFGHFLRGVPTRNRAVRNALECPRAPPTLLVDSGATLRIRESRHIKALLKFKNFVVGRDRDQRSPDPREVPMGGEALRKRLEFAGGEQLIGPLDDRPDDAPSKMVLVAAGAALAAEYAVPCSGMLRGGLVERKSRPMAI